MDCVFINDGNHQHPMGHRQNDSDVVVVTLLPVNVNLRIIRDKIHQSFGVSGLKMEAELQGLVEKSFNQALETIAADPVYWLFDMGLSSIDKDLYGYLIEQWEQQGVVQAA